MPKYMYTDVIREMVDANLTVAISREMGVLTRRNVEALADAIQVQRIGLFVHSSFDADLLRSDRINSIAMSDPVILPRIQQLWGDSEQFESVSKRPHHPSRPHLRGRCDAHPRLFDAELPASSVSVTQYSLCDMGHADLLNDRYADFGRDRIPWITGATSPRLRFADWSRDHITRDQNSVRRRRSEYRRTVAQLVSRHLTLPGAGQPLVDVDDAPAKRIAAVGQGEDEVE